MKKQIALYLAGSIKKEHDLAESFWSSFEMEKIQSFMPDLEVSFLNPAFRQDDLSDQKSVFGRDMLQVYCSDAVFVDARNRRGLGVGAEMMWARVHNIPVVSWAPKNSHYHKGSTTILGVPVENFVHPFVLALSDAVVESLEEGCLFLTHSVGPKNPEIKGQKEVFEAVQYYLQTQFERDRPMKSLIENNPQLMARLKNLAEKV